MRVSPSQLKVFKECEQAWYYSYVEGLKPKASGRHLEVGTYAHELTHVYYQFMKAFPDLKPGSMELNDMIQDRIRSDVKDMDELEGMSIIAQIAPLMSRFITYQSPRIDRGIEIIGIEQEFKVDIGWGIILHGFIDLVYRDSTGTIRIRDKKTSGQKNAWNQQKLKLNEQLLLYAAACSFMYNEPVTRVEIDFMCTAEYKNKKPPNEEIFKMFTWTHPVEVLESWKNNLIRLHGAMIRAEEGAPIRNFSEGCGTCRFYELCNLDTRGQTSALEIQKKYMFDIISRD